MKQQLQQIRGKLGPIADGDWDNEMYVIDRAKQALTALAELERMAGEPVLFIHPITFNMDIAHVCAWKPGHELEGYVPLYRAAPPAQQTVTNDEQASAYMDARLWEFIDMAGAWPTAKPDPRIWAHVMVYEPPAQQPQYEAGDMASAHNDGFRAGAASVAQQPQAEWIDGVPHWTPELIAKVKRMAAELDEPKQPQAEVGNSGFDHKTASDFLSGKTVSDEAVRKFVQASRWAHDDRASLQSMLLSVRNELASREAEIALLKKELMEAEAAPQQAEAVPDEAQSVLNRLNSSDPDFDDCAAAAALIIRMAHELKGPDGFATWKDAAMAERMRRLETSPQQAEAVPSDWAPTAANINALPAPVRAYIHDMGANADPAGTVRDLSISKQIIRELEASNRMLRDRLAEAVPNDVTRDAARYLWLRSKVGVSPEHERAYIWLPCGNSKINPAETDAAIDAAMAQGEKP